MTHFARARDRGGGCRPHSASLCTGVASSTSIAGRRSATGARAWRCAITLAALRRDDHRRGGRRRNRARARRAARTFRSDDSHSDRAASRGRTSSSSSSWSSPPQRLYARLRLRARRRSRGDRRAGNAVVLQRQLRLADRAVTKLGPGSAHVVGMFGPGCLPTSSILIVARLLGTIAKLPLLGTRQRARRRVHRFCKGRDPAVARALHRALLSALAATFATDLHQSRLAPYLVTLRRAASTTRFSRRFLGSRGRS